MSLPVLGDARGESTSAIVSSIRSVPQVSDLCLALSMVLLLGGLLGMIGVSLGLIVDDEMLSDPPVNKEAMFNRDLPSCKNLTLKPLKDI